MKPIVMAAVLLAIPLHAAEPDPATHRPHPGVATNEPGRVAPPRGPERAHPVYRSAFADYRPFDAEVPAKVWREANEEVRAAGGHGGAMSHDATKEAGR